MKTLTEQQINIAIAEAVGWKWVRHYNFTIHIVCLPSESCFEELPATRSLVAPETELDRGDSWCTDEEDMALPVDTGISVPNFCGDLNAIAQAENGLTDEQREIFVQSLCDIVFTRSINGWYDMTVNEVGKMLAATALQRATAFVRALNLEPKSK